MQDILALSSGARMNTPAKADGNWAWRMRGECINDWLAEIIYKKTALYRRLPEKKEDKSENNSFIVNN
jgi:4-alpha-glucanotransferase